MRIFYDTEFIEDGRTIEPISIGMVTEGPNPRELYVVNRAIDAGATYGKIRRHEWLMRNVVPHLPLVEFSLRQPEGDYPGTFILDDQNPDVRNRHEIADLVRDFILATPDPELWSWYGAYDHVLLAQLFGPMIALPEGVPMWTADLRQEVSRVLGGLDWANLLPTTASPAHHALEDAREVAARFAWLAGREASAGRGSWLLP